jgi:hypothetical protein
MSEPSSRSVQVCTHPYTVLGSPPGRTKMEWPLSWSPAFDPPDRPWDLSIRHALPHWLRLCIPSTATGTAPSPSTIVALLFVFRWHLGLCLGLPSQHCVSAGHLRPSPAAVRRLLSTTGPRRRDRRCCCLQNGAPGQYLPVSEWAQKPVPLHGKPTWSRSASQDGGPLSSTAPLPQKLCHHSAYSRQTP